MFLMNTICRAWVCQTGGRRIGLLRLLLSLGLASACRPVHEQRLHPGLTGLSARAGATRTDDLGHGHLAARRKQQRNIRLLQMDYVVDPDDTETLTELGIAYTRLGKGAEARRYFDRLFQTAPSEWMHSRRVLALLAEFATLEGNFQQVVDISERGLVLYPGDEYLAFLQAEALYQLGEYDHARILLLRIINGVPRPEQLCVGVLDEIQRRLAPLGLSEIFRLQGAFDQGEALLRSVVRSVPAIPLAGISSAGFALRWQAAKLRDISSRGAIHMRACAVHAASGSRMANVHGTLQMAEQLIEESLGEEPELPLLVRDVC